jgi:predicted MFS family arabinose efflux permease
MGGEGVLERWRAGFAYLRGVPGLVVAISVHSTFALAAAPIVQLVPKLSQDDLGIGAGAYGVLLGALGVGAIGAAVVLGTTDHRVRPSRALAVGLALTAIGLGGLATARGYVVSIVAMVVFGAAYLTVVAIDHGAIQRLSDDEHSWRVTIVWLMTFGACFPTGVLVMGAAADRFGTRPVLLVDAGIMATVLAVTSARGLLARLDH